jgi:hypothetical protein
MHIAGLRLVLLSMRGKIEHKEGEPIGKYGVILIKETPIPVGTRHGANREGILMCPFCGNTFAGRLGDVRHNKVRSCGCYKKLVVTQRNTKHGLSQHPLYRRWAGIKERCYNANYKAFPYYGGRGITMSDLWLNNPAAFIAYCETLQGYGDCSLSIDRINNDGNYEPGNIRFATASEQSFNTRPSSRSILGIRCVSLKRVGNKTRYQVRVVINGVRTYIGIYKSPKDAVDALNRCVIENKIPIKLQ